MNTDTRPQIETALRAFSGSNLRTASIGLLNSLGYQSEKTLDLDNTPDAFLAEFDKRDRKGGILGTGILATPFSSIVLADGAEETEDVKGVPKVLYEADTNQRFSLRNVPYIRSQ